MQVAKWGNSLAVRLPVELVRALDLREGDDITLRPDGDGFAVTRRPRAEEVLSELRRFQGRLPARDRLSRDEANSR